MIEVAVSVIGDSLVELLKRSLVKTKNTNTGTDVPALRDEEARQEIALRMVERQAKVAQELAIARKIELADEVEIEEFYESSAEGNVGAKVDDSAISLGASGKGNRVTRRVYRFKGHAAGLVHEVPAFTAATPAPAARE